MAMTVYNPAGFVCEKDFVGSDGTQYFRGDPVPTAALYAERKRDVLLSKRYVFPVWDFHMRNVPNNYERPTPTHLPTDTSFTDGLTLYTTPHGGDRVYLTRPDQEWGVYDGSPISGE